MISSEPPDALIGEDRLAYLALAMVPGVGAERLRSLLTVFRSPSGALAAPLALLRSVPGIGLACASAIIRASIDPARRLVKRMEACGDRILLPGDPSYPASLIDLEDRPPVLFGRGDLTLLDRPAVAIVGSRDHTAYGGRVAEMVAGQSAIAGLIVVSGMARGIDGLAHRAALQAGGGTIGVLGNGLGVIYPAAHRRLYADMEAGGLLITEFPPGERPAAGSFPRRNRIISGLARATVVIEAAAGSGALITARTALDQNRDVFAVPGPITSQLSVGTNGLIRDGAFPLLEMADLLFRYPELARRAPENPAPAAPARTDQARLLELLRSEPLPPDELADRMCLSGGEVLALLGGLEIGGLVRQEAGQRFALADPGFAAARPDPA